MDELASSSGEVLAIQSWEGVIFKNLVERCNWCKIYPWINVGRHRLASDVNVYATSPWCFIYNDLLTVSPTSWRFVTVQQLHK